jgi:hypothetical protein
MGLNSGDIEGWFVDNIHIDRRCDGATDLVMEKHMDYNELLWVSPYGPCWDPWIHWDDGVNAGNSIGTGSAVEFDVAARWTPSQLVSYGGTSITMVSFFPAEEAATYNVRIWTGNGPDTMIVDQPVTNPVIGQWNYVTLTNPVPLDITKELWVGYYVNTTTGYPAGVDYGPAKDGYGNMMNYGGWQTLLQINPDLDFNWNIQCLIGTYPPDPNAPGIYFNIYRKTLNGTYQFLDTANQTDYKDYDLVVPEYYCYKVTMIWTKNNDTCESGATNEVCDVIYVVNPELQPGNTIKIFPNPAKDRLNIEADEEIREIRVYDLLGDEVWKIEIGNSDYKMDVSRLQSGIYYVTVTTAKKQFREKIVVMK